MRLRLDELAVEVGFELASPAVGRVRPRPDQRLFGQVGDLVTPCVSGCVGGRPSGSVTRSVTSRTDAAAGSQPEGSASSSWSRLRVPLLKDSSSGGPVSRPDGTTPASR